MVKRITPFELERIISDSKCPIVIGYYRFIDPTDDEYKSFEKYLLNNRAIQGYIMDETSEDFLVSRYGALGTPTYLSFKDGQFIGMILGKMNKDELNRIISDYH